MTGKPILLAGQPETYEGETVGVEENKALVRRF